MNTPNYRITVSGIWGITLSIAAFLILLLLKACGAVTVGWAVVFLPLIALPVLCVCLSMILMMTIFIAKISIILKKKRIFAKENQNLN